ncbi:MAG: redoxin domain-containing protein [Sediminibacterium sp.]
MKKFIVLSLVLLSTVAQSQKQYTITGDVSKVKETVSKVYLSYYFNGVSKQDSAVVTDGKFILKGTVVEPVLGNLRAVYKVDTSLKTKRMISYKKDVTPLYLENAAIQLTSVDSFANAAIKGSKSHLEYNKLKLFTKPVSDKMEALSATYNELYKKKDEAGMKKLDEEYDKLDAEMKAKQKEYVLANLNSPIVMYAFGNFAGYSIKADEVEPLFLKIPLNVRNSVKGKEMADKIDIAKKTGIGKPAIQFTQNDTAGIPVSLASFKGKYVLVDFWASWCGPCRQENPNVVAAFAKYNAKGFTVLGVSLDQPTGKERWMEAIHKDNLTWTQVSDLKYWKNEVAVMYGVQAIPQNYLIDPQGVIIGKDLRGDALNSKLAELFK